MSKKRKNFENRVFVVLVNTVFARFFTYFGGRARHALADVGAARDYIVHGGGDRPAERLGN